MSEFARWVQDSTDRLDVLVNNAGVHLDLRSAWHEPHLVDGIAKNISDVIVGASTGGERRLEQLRVGECGSRSFAVVRRFHDAEDAVFV